MTTIILLTSVLNLAWGQSSFASQYHCFHKELHLHITLLKNASHPMVLWSLKSQKQDAEILHGQGPLSVESLTDFSSYDEDTAVAYKPGRAALVFKNDQALVFKCN